MPIQTVEEAAADATNIFKVDDNYDDHAYAEGHYKGFLRGAAWQREQGIEWVKVSDGLPSIDHHLNEGNDRYSKQVCITNGHEWQKATAKFNKNNKFVQWLGAGIYVTHWAYINLPTE